MMIFTVATYLFDQHQVDLASAFFLPPHHRSHHRLFQTSTGAARRFTCLSTR